MVLQFDLASLSRASGSSSYARGEAYARQGAVLRAEWDPVDSALRGTVRGHGGYVYETSASFSLTDGRPAQFEEGDCSCPMEFNCKHVVALVLSTLKPGSTGRDTSTRQVPAPKPPTWEQPLESLLGLGGAGSPGAVPLAIELALVGGASQANWNPAAKSATSPAPLRLIAKPVKPGKNGGWISTGLSWGKLETLSWSHEYNEQHLRLLRELHVLHQACRSRSSGYNGYYSDDRSIDLSSMISRQFWPLLDEAQEIGLRLVYPGKRGALENYAEAEFCLDVTRDDAGALRLAPVIRVGDGQPALPVAFIGAEGHGAVCVDRAEPASGQPGGWRFRLVRLARPVPPPMQQLTLGGEALAVPASEAARFRDSYCPRLRRSAALISSDGSFSPPEITGPDLVLRARYGSGHELELNWEWAYQVGDSPLRLPLEAGGPEDGYRDLPGEKALLAGLDLPFDRYGLLVRGRRGGHAPGEPDAQLPPIAPQVRLTGVDTMRFTTELLPLLADQPGLDRRD